MKGTFRITNIYGIPLRVHWSFLFLLLWVVFSGFDSNWHLEWSHLWKLLILLFALFSCVILHELGHALVARRHGIKTQSIILLPVGGVAILDNELLNPKKEFYISIIGPLVNFGIAFLFVPFLFFLDSTLLEQMGIFIFHLDSIGSLSGRIPFLHLFVFFMIMLNIIIGVFNLIPVLPMDGGRALRALLSTKFGRQSATKIVLLIGVLFSATFVVVGIIQSNWVLIFIGLYIFSSSFRSFKFSKPEKTET